jgi:hypothetical protein
LFFVQAACAIAADPRPPLKGVSALRIANYGAPSVLLEGREKVNPIIEELNGLRGKAWLRGDAKITCYATLVLLSGSRTGATIRIRSDLIVERSADKGQPIYRLALDPADIPTLSRLLTEIPPAKGCG